MSGIEITSEILTLIVTAITSMGATLPFIARFKMKLSQTNALIIAIETALEDDKVTRNELKIIGRYASELLGTKRKTPVKFLPGD